MPDNSNSNVPIENNETIIKGKPDFVFCSILLTHYILSLTAFYQCLFLIWRNTVNILYILYSLLHPHTVKPIMTINSTVNYIKL